MSKEEELDLLKSTAERLGEHFDTVQIFTTRHDQGGEGGTVNVSWGVGNWFARAGQVREWLVKNDECVRAEIRRSEENL